MKPRKRTILCALLVFFVPLVAGSESGNLHRLLDETGAALQWDPFRGQGVLIKKGKTVTFKPEVPYLVFDYGRKESVEPVRMENGVPVFAQGAVEKVKAFFAEPVKEPGSHTVRTIIIDPGHGGRDAGAVATHTFNGKKVTLEEKQIVLDVSLEVARLLERKYPDKKVLLTRKTDVYPSLEERVELANGVLPDNDESIVYISIHANASPFNKAARGFEAWYLPPDYRRDLVDPSSVSSGGKEILPILNTMREEEYTLESILLARSITAGMERSVGSLSPNRGLKEQSWFVVRNAKMPSVLIELGFITNEPEAALLHDPSYLKKLSEGIYNGVVGFTHGFENPENRTE